MESAVKFSTLEIKPPFNPSLLLIWIEHRSRDNALPAGVVLAALRIQERADMLSALRSSVGYGFGDWCKEGSWSKAVVAAAYVTIIVANSSRLIETRDGESGSFTLTVKYFNVRRCTSGGQ